jgi:putative Mg2+ transporter-C (MgtC) family protein
VALGDVVVEHFAVDVGSELTRSDPARIVEAIVTSFAFLGAGTILRHRDGRRIEGLTTAAAILFVAGVGVSVALSQYVVAVGVTALVFVTLCGVGLMQQLYERRER